MLKNNVYRDDLNLHFQDKTFQVAILTKIGRKLQILLLPSD